MQVILVIWPLVYKFPNKSHGLSLFCFFFLLPAAFTEEYFCQRLIEPGYIKEVQKHLDSVTWQGACI